MGGDGMAQQCPECGVAVEAAPWCASCGAWLGDAPAPRERQDAGRGRRVAAAVVAVAALAAFVALAGDDEEAGLPGAADVVPVEDAEVLPPTAPPLAGPVGRQFAVEATILWGRRLTAAAAGAWTLAPTGTGVTVLDDGSPVLTVDPASGEELALGAAPAPTDPVFESTAGRVTVEGEAAALEGVVDGEVVWRAELGAPLAAAPIRAGTSVVVALRSGEVAALSPADGTARWRRDLGVVPTAVAGDGTVLLVGTADGRVLRLDPNGTPVTTATTGDGPVLALTAGRPAVVLLADRLVGLDVTG